MTGKTYGNSKQITARQVALLVLHEVEMEDAYSNIALNRILEKHPLNKIDRSFVTEIAYGTLRVLNTLDWVIGQFIKRPLDTLTPWIRNILRLSLYQIMYMDKVPVSAAINEGVELAKRYGHQGTVKFVNGVLRNIDRKLSSLTFPDLAKDPVQHIAIKYSHPEWLVKRWITEFGVEETIKICQANNEAPPNIVRTNTLKLTRDSLVTELEGEGVQCNKTKYASEGLVIENLTSIGRLESFNRGYFQPQDESSMLVARVVDPKPNQVVIDACSAPGGKTTHISQLMENQGQVIAADIYKHKMGLIIENAKRLGITNIKTETTDARDLAEKFSGQADRILVDAPCSGLGVLRRRPDARWRKSLEQIQELQTLQLEILTKVSPCLRPGGVLVYSTCSTTPEENVQVVEAFLKDNSDFIVSDLTQYLPKDLLKFSDLEPQKGYIQLLPHVHGMDGFFIARFVKKAGF